MQEYITHRLAVAGCESADLFDEDTFATIHRYTGGVPRLINTLCDTALLCAFADEKSNVDLADVQSAIEELNWHEHESSTGRHQQLMDIQRQKTSSDDVTRIEVLANGELVAEHTLPLGRVIVGRSSDNEVFIDSKFVSRHHAQLVSDERGCVIEDLNSTNGVYVGQRQVKKYRLLHGDTVSVGSHELVYYDLRLEKRVEDDAPKENEVADEEA